MGDGRPGGGVLRGGTSLRATAARIASWQVSLPGGIRRRRDAGRRFYRWRVPCGYAVGAVVLILARTTPESLLVGLALMVPGQGLRLWASGHIDKTSRLATGGPYGHTQHPLYLGSVAIALGVAVTSASFAVVGAVSAYLLAFFPYVMRDEREFLRRRFGEAYDRWAAAVPPFLPQLSAAGPRETRFQWRRVLSNGEWKACLAPPAGLALLHLKQAIASAGLVEALLR